MASLVTRVVKTVFDNLQSLRFDHLVTIESVESGVTIGNRTLSRVTEVPVQRLRHILVPSIPVIGGMKLFVLIDGVAPVRSPSAWVAARIFLRFETVYIQSIVVGLEPERFLGVFGVAFRARILDQMRPGVPGVSHIVQALIMLV